MLYVWTLGAVLIWALSCKIFYKIGGRMRAKGYQEEIERVHIQLAEVEAREKKLLEGEPEVKPRQCGPYRTAPKFVEDRRPNITENTTPPTLEEIVEANPALAVAVKPPTLAEQVMSKLEAIPAHRWREVEHREGGPRSRSLTHGAYKIFFGKTVLFDDKKTFFEVRFRDAGIELPRHRVAMLVKKVRQYYAAVAAQEETQRKEAILRAALEGFTSED